MNAQIKRDWLEALRSGEYKQGFGQLKFEEDNETKYCCLGVLCDVLINKHSDKFPDLRWDGDTLRSDKIVKNSHYLPVSIINRLKLKKKSEGQDITFKVNIPNGKSENTVEIKTYASHLNDGEVLNLGNVNFNQIADLIEEQL